MAKVASEASVVGGVSTGEEQFGEDDDRGGGINVEVEELDGGADETGEEYLGARVRLLFSAWHGSIDVSLGKWSRSSAHNGQRLHFC